MLLSLCSNELRCLVHLIAHEGRDASIVHFLNIEYFDRLLVASVQVNFSRFEEAVLVFDGDLLTNMFVEIISFLHAKLDALVESILDVIVCASEHIFGDLSPARTEPQIELSNADIFLECPSILLDARVKLVEPALSALLSDAARDHCCD